MAKQITGNQTDEQALATADDDAPPRELKDILKDVIKVEVSDAGVLRKGIRVTVPRANINDELDKEYKELLSEAVVPGFRRGRAPRRLVEKRFGQEVGAQVRVRLLSNAFLAAVEKQDLKVLGDPMIWIQRKSADAKGKPDSEELVDMRTAIDQLKIPEEGDFDFRCEVEVKPEFEMPKLEGVEIERPKLEISDDDVDAQIDRIRRRRGNWVPVIDGKVEADDMMVCDLSMTVDGKEVEKVENAQLAARAQVIEGVTFDDLGDKFKGAKVGDTRTLEGHLPDDYKIEDLRGKKAKFEFKLNDIKRLQMAPLDKDYLAANGFDSEKEFRDHVRKQMEGQLEYEIKRGMQNQARKYLLEATKLDLPEGLSARQTDRAVLRRAIELQRQGVPASEIEKHADELRTSARTQALAELKLHFILEEIAEKLEIEVSEEEINAAIAGIAQTYNRRFDRVRDELVRNDGLDMLYLQIRDDKCIDKILEQAKITDAKLPEKEQKAAKPAKSESGAKAVKAPEKKAAPEKPEAKAKASDAGKGAKASAPKSEGKKKSK